jgi:hypothetical protein
MATKTEKIEVPITYEESTLIVKSLEYLIKKKREYFQ